MTTDDEDLTGEVDESGLGQTGALRRRTWKQSQRIKELRAELEAATARYTKAETALTGETVKLTAAKAEHKTAIDAATVAHTGVLERMERVAALGTAGVEADGHATVLAAYAALENAPPLGEWLAGDTLPKHVSCYLATDAAKGPGSVNPDAGTGARSTSSGGQSPGFLNGATIADLRAMKAAGDL